jgi:hypothetical protein
VASTLGFLRARAAFVETSDTLDENPVKKKKVKLSP